MNDDDEMSRDALVTSLTAENEQLFHDCIDLTTENDRMRALLGRLRFLIGPVDDDALIGFMERAIDKANVLEDENKRLRAVVEDERAERMAGFQRLVEAENVTDSLHAENERLRAEVAEWRDEAWRASYDAANMKANIVAIRELWSNIVVLELGDDVPVAAFPLAHHEAIERLLNGQTT